ncbi:MAG: hypothetical protein NTZ05_05110, partial [Chloroflexi bacterium]|nr:hypothetical protein [Chloroflexota bacterium]
PRWAITLCSGFSTEDWPLQDDARTFKRVGFLGGLLFLAVVAGAAVLGIPLGESTVAAPPLALSPTANTAPQSAADVLRHAQEAIDRAGSYHAEMRGQNFVLPQWGGIDRGSFDIGAHAATGAVQRTGEGSYAIVVADPTTFFRRETCDRFARIPGGGRDVLRPFLWIDSDLLTSATNPTIATDAPVGGVAYDVDLRDWGRVRLELESVTLLPIRLSSPRNAASGSEATLTFSDWRKAVTAEKPAGEIYDRGPGGIPC